MDTCNKGCNKKRKHVVEGFFDMLLRQHYDEAQASGKHPDVVREKREAVGRWLVLLHNALRHHQYREANFFMFNICDKLLNDPHSDEYGLEPVDFDVAIFSSCVLSIHAKHYERVQQIISALILKYRNPIFTYCLAVAYFYDMQFEVAKHEFSSVLEALSENKCTTFPWPTTHIMITMITAKELREDTLVFLDIIKLLSNKPSSTRITNNITEERIQISSNSITVFQKLDLNIGFFLQTDIYPYVRTILSDIMKFDKRRLPIALRKVVKEKYTPPKGVRPKDQAKAEKPGKEDQTKVEKSNKRINLKKMDLNRAPPQLSESKKSIATQVKILDPLLVKTVSVASGTDLLKKNESIQVSTSFKSKQIQTCAKLTHQNTQTTEDVTGLSEKCKANTDNENLNLKLKLQHVGQKLKETETKWNKEKLKTDLEIQEKNKLIAEQQEIISDLKVKLQQASLRQKELEGKLSKSNSKVTDLQRSNKVIIAESEKNKETITELQNYNQILEKNAKIVRNKQDEMRAIQKSLFEKYRSSYFSQIKFYESVHTRCNSIVTVMQSIMGHLTEITIPTKAECEESIKHWCSTMAFCQEVIQKNQKIYYKFDKYTSEDSLKELLNMAIICSIKEPQDILLEKFPILIYTVADFEKRLQSNPRAKKNKNKGENAENIGANNESAVKIEYRKKSNYIHKNGLQFTSDGGTVLSNRNSQENCADTNSLKLNTLMAYLKHNIANKSEDEIVKALNEYRDLKNGSLSGMTVPFILHNVNTILNLPEAARSNLKEHFSKPEEEKVNCPICLEPIVNGAKSVLKCKHVYHTGCIQEWFAINRICAVCRMYTVLDEDFPPLTTAD